MKAIFDAKKVSSLTARLRKCVDARNLKVLILVLTVPLLSSGCGLVSGKDSTASTTPNSSSASFQVTPGSLNFGSVPVGKQTSQTVTVANTGPTAVNITHAALSNNQFTMASGSMPMALGAGKTGTFSVAVNPSASGSVSGTLTVQGDNGTSPVIIGLAAMGMMSQPQIALGGTVVDFGTVAVNAQGSASVSVTNVGGADLTISSITVSGAGFGISGIAVPKTIGAGQSATLGLTFRPTAAGAVTGSVTVASNDPTTPTATITLAGTASTAPANQLSISPASFNFGSVVDGQTKSQTFTVTNNGSSAVTIAQVAVQGSAYSVSGLAAPANLAAGQSAAFTTEFAPTTANVLAGTVSISGTTSSTPVSAALSGTGVAATATMAPSPASVSFGSVSAGSTATQNVTLTNTGNSTLTISNVSVSAKDVKASGIATPMTLAVGQKVNLALAFDPQGSETLSGSVTVSSSQGTSTVIPVGGSGVQPALSMTPTSVSFGSVSVGSTNSQTIKLTNSGTGTLTISQVNVSGSGLSSSGLSLPISLSAGQSSTFGVQFAPKAAGAVMGTASIVSNATGNNSVSLSGTAVSTSQTVSFSSKSLSFGNVTNGSSSTQSVTVTNTGNTNVTISQISETGATFTLSGAGVPVTLTPSQTLTFGVNFNPTAAGNASGSVLVVSNATGSPTTITLAGTGVASATHVVDLSWTASTSNVTGYNVYRSTTSGGGYTLANGGLVASLNYTDSSVQNGATYYYVTTAVDSNGDESAYSNEVQAIVP